MAFAEETKDSFTQSEWSAPLASLMRIATLKGMMHEARIEMKYQKYFKVLEGFYMELTAVLTEEEIKEEEKTYHELLNYMNEYGIKPTIPIELYDKIRDWEKRLRQLDQSKNLNFPKKKDARFALARD